MGTPGKRTAPAVHHEHYLANVTKSASIGIPTAAIEKAPDWGLGKTPVHWPGGEDGNFYSRPGSVIYDEVGFTKSLQNAHGRHIFVSFSDKEEFEAYKTKLAGKVECPQKGKAEICPVHKDKCVGGFYDDGEVRGFWGPMHILEDVSDRFKKFIHNNAGLITAVENYEAIAKRAEAGEEALKRVAMLEAEKASMLAEHDKLRAQLAIQQQQSVIQSAVADNVKKKAN